MAGRHSKSDFTRATFAFLRELADNNDRDWFAANKARYEADVLGPALDFIEAMGPAIAKLSGHFVAIPKRSGGSLMRIYRDTRFARDKTPYKTNVGIQFRHESGKDVHAPGLYVHVEPGGCFLGAGIWRPEPDVLAKIRARIVESPQDWRRAGHNKRFTDYYELSGSTLQRPPKGFSPDAAFIDDLKRKDFIGIASLDDAVVTDPDFVRVVTDHFRRSKPLLQFLCEALELPF